MLGIGCIVFCSGRSQGLSCNNYALSKKMCGLRVSMLFHHIYVHYTFSDHNDKTSQKVLGMCDIKLWRNELFIYGEMTA